MGGIIIRDFVFMFSLVSKSRFGQSFFSIEVNFISIVLFSSPYSFHWWAWMTASGMSLSCAFRLVLELLQLMLSTGCSAF